jgi:hypothetical protein
VVHPVIRWRARLTATRKIVGWWLKGAATIREVVGEDRAHDHADQNDPEHRKYQLLTPRFDTTSMMYLSELE